MGAVRLFLALIVAFDHFWYIVLVPLGLQIPLGFRLGFNAGFAVMFFYMISGFLISTALSAKYPPNRGGTIRFYQSRFVRIFSLYWPLALMTIALYGPAWHWLLNAAIPDKLTGLLLFGVDWRVSSVAYPLPYGGAVVPGIEQAWTLGVELTFYLLAPWLLRSWRIALVLLLMSFALRSAVAWTVGFHAIWNYTAFPGALVFFLLGHFARVLGDAWPLGRNRWVGIMLTLACFALSAATPLRANDGALFWITVLLFAAGLPGLFDATKNNRLLNLLGELSYPAYLVHMLVNLTFSAYAIVLIAALPKVGAWPITITYLSAVVAAAVIAHWTVERPVGAAMKIALAQNAKRRLPIPLPEH